MGVGGGQGGGGDRAPGHTISASSHRETRQRTTKRGLEVVVRTHNPPGKKKKPSRKNSATNKQKQRGHAQTKLPIPINETGTPSKHGKPTTSTTTTTTTTNDAY